MKKYKSLIPTLLILLFEALIGILLIANGEHFTRFIIIAFGVLLIIGAAVTLIRGLIDRKKSGETKPLPFTAAAAMAIAGIFFIAASGVILPAMVLILGIIMALNGFFKLSEFLYLRKMSNISLLTAINPIITIILGFVIAFNPFGANDLMWKIIGIMITAAAVFDLIALIYMAVTLRKTTAKNTVDVEGKEVDD